MSRQPANPSAAPSHRSSSEPFELWNSQRAACQERGARSGDQSGQPSSRVNGRSFGAASGPIHSAPASPPGHAVSLHRHCTHRTERPKTQGEGRTRHTLRRDTAHRALRTGPAAQVVVPLAARRGSRSRHQGEPEQHSRIKGTHHYPGHNVRFPSGVSGPDATCPAAERGGFKLGQSCFSDRKRGGRCSPELHDLKGQGWLSCMISGREDGNPRCLSPVNEISKRSYCELNVRWLLRTAILVSHGASSTPRFFQGFSRIASPCSLVPWWRCRRSRVCWGLRRPGSRRRASSGAGQLTTASCFCVVANMSPPHHIINTPN